MLLHCRTSAEGHSPMDLSVWINDKSSKQCFGRTFVADIIADLLSVIRVRRTFLHDNAVSLVPRAIQPVWDNTKYTRGTLLPRVFLFVLLPVFLRLSMWKRKFGERSSIENPLFAPLGRNADSIQLLRSETGIHFLTFYGDTFPEWKFHRCRNYSAFF